MLMQDSYSYPSQWVLFFQFDLVVHVSAAIFFFMTISEFMNAMRSSGHHQSMIAMFMGKESYSPILTAFVRDGTVFYVL